MKQSLRETGVPQQHPSPFFATVTPACSDEPDIAHKQGGFHQTTSNRTRDGSRQTSHSGGVDDLWRVRGA